MEKRVRILCQKGLLLKSSFLFLSISAMPALAIGGNTLKIDNTDEVVVLQKGKTISIRGNTKSKSSVNIK